MQIRQFFLNGDIKGAIAYMREHEEFQEVLPAYIAIFENCKYRTYDVPESLNQILRLYQVYYREIFYCGMPEAEAAGKLLTGLKNFLNMPTEADEAVLTKQLQSVFEAAGYHALFGKTQGYYGPYIWRETIPTVYQVALPGGTAEYTVNILKGFVFRSWMDYLTFGRYGTGGWASPDGTINCIAQAYDFESERFLVSLLKHEAQHTVDMKRFSNITPTELEYRAKLVELHYANDLGLLQKFLSQADENRESDSHAVASARIKREFADTDQTQLSCIQTRALDLLYVHTKKMKERYGNQKVASDKVLFTEEIMEHTNKLIGCCGLDCETCDARIAMLTNDNDLHKKTAAMWTKLNGVTITPEMINCTGCRIEGAKTPFCDKLCPVHNCIREKGLDTCADCRQMDGCPTLGQIAANSLFVLENLKRLKQDNA